MLSLFKDLVKQNKKGRGDLPPITVVFWSDFMINPAIMYNLFSDTPNKLNYDPDHVKVIGTKDGMINQINIKSVEDLDAIHEELLGMPLLMRVWAEHTVQTAYENPDETHKWEGDLALLVDTSHPRIRPELERALERARKLLQSKKLFCIQVDFGPAIQRWLKKSYPKGCCTLGTLRDHKARLFVTNHSKPNHIFDCNLIWLFLLAPCWLLTAPFYLIYRSCKVLDLSIVPATPIVRRVILPSGKFVEASR